MQGVLCARLGKFFPDFHAFEVPLLSSGIIFLLSAKRTQFTAANIQVFEIFFVAGRSHANVDLHFLGVPLQGFLGIALLFGNVTQLFIHIRKAGTILFDTGLGQFLPQLRTAEIPLFGAFQVAIVLAARAHGVIADGQLVAILRHTGFCHLLVDFQASDKIQHSLYAVRFIQQPCQLIISHGKIPKRLHETIFGQCFPQCNALKVPIFRFFLPALCLA